MSFWDDSFWDDLERASEEVDTWPDWKLDSASLYYRDKRRRKGEIFPKPTKEQIRITQLEAEVKALKDTK